MVTKLHTAQIPGIYPRLHRWSEKTFGVCVWLLCFSRPIFRIFDHPLECQ